ncbi:MAG: flagellar assembly protein FliH [Burkholderiales bacterium]|nr:flagellar assembly protein FliH [Burkholderiales bacterium]
MSSTAIPKEQLTAYQRWELDTFDAPTEVPSGGARKKNDKAPILPTAAQLERLHQQAHEEGYAAGMREGSERAAAEALRLRQIVAALAEESRHFDQGVADELLQLGLAISKQVLRHALALRPELILAVVNEVIGQLPLSHQRAHLILHPEDATLVRQSLGERLQQSGWEIIENAEISRGGCRLEAPECDIDATLERRWQRVVEAIGNGHAWLE